MLSLKTKAALALFLECLKEDTGLEPESMDFWQYDHNGNTTEAHANALVSKLSFQEKDHIEYKTVIRDIKENDLRLNFYYSFVPEVPEEDKMVNCYNCGNDFDRSDMFEDGEVCLKCHYELKKEDEEEAKALLREWEHSR